MSINKDVANVLENRNLSNMQSKTCFSTDGNKDLTENRTINSPADTFNGN